MQKRFLRKYDGKKGEWLKAGERFVLLLIVVFLIFRFLVGVSWVSGHSMEPTLQNNAMVFYTRVGNHFSKGDIVSIRMAYGEYYIKRIVAVSGDTVDIHDGSLFVNGKMVDSWSAGETLPSEIQLNYPITIPEGKFFVLGDNREISIDSRTFGPISRSQIIGKVQFSIG